MSYFSLHSKIVLEQYRRTRETEDNWNENTMVGFYARAVYIQNELN